MLYSWLKIIRFLLLSLYFVGTINKTFAQIPPISPASDTTGTIVTPNNNNFDISGGTIFGTNLFHSFERFNVNQNSIANFLSNSNIQNILARITGGEVSLINGLIQITGGNSNLFLMNPAGIIFGSNASLNVSGDFIATTATGIGFGNNNWFNAFGNNNYATLLGTPNNFAFNLSQPGSIINSGNLKVNTGKNIFLIGGNVINNDIGKLTAPGGNITIVAVPGTSLVRISQPGNLLSLEINPSMTSNPSQITPLLLPQLLTGEVPNYIVSIITNSTAKKTIASGNINVSDATGGSVNILGEEIDVINSNMIASGGNINLTSNQIFLTSNSGNITGSGNLVLQALNPSLDLTIGGNGDAKSTFLNSDELAILNNGFNTITIGGNNSSGIITLGDNVTFNVPVILRSPSGTINISNSITATDNASVTLNAAHNILNANITSNNQNIILNGGNTTLGNNNIILTAGGNINLNTPLNFNGIGIGKTLTFNANKDILINQQIFGSVTGGDSLNLILNANKDNISSGRVVINQPISTTGGNITINANSINNDAVNILSSLNSEGGNINITGNTNNGFSGIHNQNNINAGSGNITLTSDRIFIESNLSGSGNLVLQPLNPSLNLTIGGNGDAKSTFLNSAELATFNNGFNTITIGANNSSGIITLGDNVTFNVPVILRSTSGTINISNSITGNASITLNAANTQINTNITSKNSNIILNGGNTTLANNVTLSAGKDIILNSSNVTAGANIFLAADTKQNSIGIFKLNPNSVLNTAGNSLVISAADIQLSENSLIDVGVGNITFQPSTNTSSIGIGKNATGAFNLNTTELTTNLNSTGIVTIGNPNLTGSGDVEIRNANLSGKNYNLNINGGNINFVNNLGNSSINNILTLPDNKIAKFIANGTILGDSTINIKIAGENGTVLLDAATGINKDSPNNRFNVEVQNVAARTRNSGNIFLNFGTENVSISNVGNVNGIVANNGGIILGHSSGGNLTINQPISILSGNFPIILGVENTAQINLNNFVTSNGGDITFRKPLILGNGGGSIVSNGGNIIFNNSINGNQPLNLSAGNGRVQFDDGVGIQTPPTNIEITADKINFSNIINSNSQITLQPFTASQNISIGGVSGDQNNVLYITNAELNNLSDNLSSLIIGNASGSGTITLANNVNFKVPVILRSTLGTININHAITGTGNTSITLNSNNNILNSNISSQNQSINLNGNNTTLGNNNVTLTAGKDINLNTPLNFNGTGINKTLAFDANNNILINQPIFDSVIGGDSLNLILNTHSGNVVISNSIFTQGGNITINGNNMDNNPAISILNNINSGGGNIDLNGNHLSKSDGVYIGNSLLNSENGNINIIGASNGGVGIHNQGVINAGSGNITLTSNQISLDSNPGSITGNGNLLIQPIDATLNLTLAGKENIKDTFLNSAELATLNNNFKLITIGRNNSSGTISLADNVNFESSLILRSPFGVGSINTTGYTLGTKDNANINLLANQQINIGNIINSGGAIDITSKNSMINASSGKIISNGGRINLTAKQDIITAEINSSNNNYVGGNININSQSGSVNLGNINTNGQIASGKIAIVAADSISTGKINSSASAGNGGNVILNAQNNIIVNTINTQGGNNGIGGEINISTSGLFRADGIFSDNNRQLVSISTAGGVAGGAISIHQGGGTQNQPFRIGKATTNGTAAGITTGAENTIPPFRFFPGNYTQNNIIITTENAPKQEPSPAQEISLSQIALSTTTPSTSLDTVSNKPEEILTRSFEQFLGKPPESPIKNFNAAQEVLRKIQFATAVKPALIYFIFTPTTIVESEWRSPKAAIQNQDNDQLEIILVSANEPPIRRRVNNVNRASISKMAQEFRSELTNPNHTEQYLTAAQQLYQWLIAPIDADLKNLKIQNLAFLMDNGLRSLPIAALHDGNKFLIEKYSLGMMPSLSLTDTNYVDIKNSKVLGMGAEKFADQTPLPGVGVELNIITKQLWQGKSLLNDQFTLNNLKEQRRSEPYAIIHLATHGEFKSGALSNSYIQLWDSKLRLDQLGKLGFDKPPVELLVLSACRTALGSEEAEFGFAGLSILAGVKTAMGSLWYVSDEGTLALMTSFYEELKKAPIKAEALRKAQLAMLKGQVRLQGGKLHTPSGDFSLPSNLQNSAEINLRHPFFWSAFTMIGNPW